MKTLPWIRLYVEVIDDEKLGLLAFEDRWHYIALLACKGRGLLDKDEPAELTRRKVALKLGLAVRELEEVARRLAEVGLIDRESMQPQGWGERQFKSDADSTAAERQRRHRAAKREAEQALSRVTSRTSHADVTRPDTDTDTEEEREPADAAPPPPAKPITLTAYLKQCAKAGTKPIPDDHYIRRYMEDAGITHEMGQIAWLRFREEHTQGARKDKRYKDWPGTFANSVKSRWYRLWIVNNEGEATWTSEGLQEKRAILARQQVAA
ncbi:MAG: hypothetical protein ACK40S_13140 [Burkholderiaceae bacterium]